MNFWEGLTKLSPVRGLLQTPKQVHINPASRPFTNPVSIFLEQAGGWCYKHSKFDEKKSCFVAHYRILDPLAYRALGLIGYAFEMRKDVAAEALETDGWCKGHSKFDLKNTEFRCAF